MGSFLNWLFGKKDEEHKAYENISNQDIITNKNTTNKEGKLRIYLYGNNLSNLFSNNKDDLKIQQIKNINYLYYKDEKDTNWEYLIFESKVTKEINDAISAIMQGNFIKSKFYEMIIVSVDSLKDNQTSLFIEHFQKTKQKAKQPFILFLTKEKNPKIEDIYDLISNQYFDKRNINAMEFPLDNDNKKILDYILKIISYYNEFGDLYDINEVMYQYLFNCLICGTSGTGKSTFINLFLHSKRAKEGEGLSVTHNITRFLHPQFPICIYDTPGFEDARTVENVKNLIIAYNKHLKDARKKINLILYFLPYSHRTLLEMEKPMIDYLTTFNTEIIFVVNHVTDNLSGDDFLNYKESLLDSLGNSITDNPNFSLRVVPVNLYQKIDKGKVITKAFGLDNLFEEIYNIYKPFKVKKADIEQIKTVQELFDFFKNNPLYNHFENKLDFLYSFQTQMSNLVLSYSLKNLFTKKEQNIKKMIEEIYNNFSNDHNEEKFYNDIMKEFSTNQIDELYENFFNNLHLLKTLNKEVNTFSFFKKLHDKETVAIGNFCLNKLNDIFKKDPNFFINDNKPDCEMIERLSLSLNNAIDSFHTMSLEFKEIYKQLEERNELESKKLSEKKEKEKSTTNETDLEQKVISSKSDLEEKVISSSKSDLEENIESSNSENSEKWWIKFFN